MCAASACLDIFKKLARQGALVLVSASARWTRAPCLAVGHKAGGPAASCHGEKAQCSIHTFTVKRSYCGCVYQSPVQKGVCLKVHYRAGPLLRLQVKRSSADGECNRWQVGHIGASTHNLIVTRRPVIHHSRDCLHWHGSHQGTSHHNR